MLIERDLLQVHGGRLAFDEFARRSAAYWWSVARSLRGRWIVPAGVEVDDVLQELLLAAWVHVQRWDRKRGVSITRFVTWNAISDAAHWLHGQRSAHKRRGTSRSRHAICDASLDPSEQTATAIHPQAEPDQMMRMIEQEALAEALARVDGAQRAVVASAAVALDLGLVAETYYRDTEFRRHCRWGCEAEARRFVRASLIKAAGEESMS